MGNREKLLAAAKTCLFTKGYGHTTFRDLAGEAGVSMAAIGYHFGSKEALLNTALFEALNDGDAFGGGDTPRDYTAFWERLLAGFADHRTFWIANFEAVLQAQRDPELREQLAAGLQMGRSGIAADVTGEAEDELSPDTVRGLGSVQLALLSGLALQMLTDPDNAPATDEIVAGIRALADLSRR